MNPAHTWPDRVLSRRTITGQLVARHTFRRLPYWFAPMAALLFGGVLLLPGDTLHLSPSFIAMLQAGDSLFGRGNAEIGWGFVIAGAGAMHLVAVLFTLTRLLPLLTLWLIAVLFAGMAASFAMSSGVNSTGTGQYSLTALMAAWAYVHWES